MNKADLFSADSVTGQFLRYLVVGGIAFVADYGVLISLTECVDLHYLVSAAIAFTAGLAVNYTLSIAWVFTSRSLTSKKTEFIIFTVIGILGLGWTELLMYLGTDIFGCDYRITKLLVVAIVLCWNFGMRKLILFSRPAV